jgi:UDP-N-acetylglucosamine 3-dehydrogenase
MPGGQLGVGVIGCGGIANGAHLPNYARNPRVKVVAVADVDRERARSTAERWQVDSYYEDYHDLLARADVEAVSITTPVFAHAEPALAAMRAGKHVLCEKPIARTLAEADAMVETARKAGVLFTMGYQSRFSRLWETSKRILDEGVIGRMMAMNVVSTGRAALPQPWFLDKDLAGGGVLMDWGIYTAYMLNWLAGPVSAVQAVTRAFRHEYTAAGKMVHDVKVEDSGVATLEFASGAIGVWYSTWAGLAGHGYTAIDGTEGSFVMRSADEGGSLVFTAKSSDPDYLQGWRKLPFRELPLADQHYRKLDHLVAAVLDGTPLVMTGADGRQALELIQAMYQSADTGQRVQLPLPR